MHSGILKESGDFIQKILTQPLTWKGNRSLSLLQAAEENHAALKDIVESFNKNPESVQDLVLELELFCKDLLQAADDSR
jgi:hypothetical protein